MRRPLLACSLLFLACPPTTNGGGLLLTFQLDHSVVNDGSLISGTVSFTHQNPLDLNQAHLTLSTSLGVVTPTQATLATNDFQQVTYSCDVATNAGCLGQAVLTAELQAGQEVAVASTTVQILEPDDGSVRQFDGGLCGGGVFPGSQVTCCFDPATNDAPGCGWTSAQPGLPFAMPLITSDGGTASSQVTVNLAPVGTCASAPLVNVGDGGVVSWSCRGYGIDSNTGVWRLLADRTCTQGDGFVAQNLCPLLSQGNFANAAYVMTDLSVGGVGVTAPTTGAFLVFQP